MMADVVLDVRHLTLDESCDCREEERAYFAQVGHGFLGRQVEENQVVLGSKAAANEKVVALNFGVLISSQESHCLLLNKLHTNK
jgi:hypothetical protein